MSTPNTPLFVKTHDFNLWLWRHTQRFPKHLRHSYTIRLETAAWEFEEAILMANSARGPERLQWLTEADGRLLCLRALLRYAYDLGLLAGNQVAHAAGLVDELGRLLGAWQKGDEPLSAGSNRVIRGGNWNNNASNGRSAYRNNNAPVNRNNNNGFRVLRVW